MGFANGAADDYLTQLCADTYAIGTQVGEAIDVINFHSVGIIATCDGDDITENVSVTVQCNDTWLFADPAGWVTVGAIFQRSSGTVPGVLVNTATDAGTWGAASTDADNLIFDCIKTEDLPLSGNGLPSRYMRITAANAAEEVFSVVIFSTDADYLGGGGDWGDVPAEQR